MDGTAKLTDVQAERIREAVAERGGKVRLQDLPERSVARLVEAGAVEPRLDLPSADYRRRAVERIGRARDLLEVGFPPPEEEPDGRDAAWKRALRELREAEADFTRAESAAYVERALAEGRRLEFRWSLREVGGYYVTAEGRRLAGIPEDVAGEAPKG